jgi:hypothetical protein
MVVEDFALGMDLRKSPVTASAKSLRLLRNGYVNAGGEIEKRRAFLDTNVNLTGTHGLGGLGLSVYVFGSTARPGTLDAWIGYQQLVGASIARIADVDVFDNQFYVVVQQPDGNYAHYYNGAHVAGAPNAGQALAHRSKMYAIRDNIVYFSAVGDPTIWASGAGTPGAGFIQLDGQDSGTVNLVGLATYYDQLAIFSRTACQLWAMDEDPAQNQLIQTVDATGLVAFKALARYSTGDVLFLHDSGVRSLKARDSSNAASISDIGSPLDDILRKVVSDARRVDSGALVPAGLINMVAIVEPNTGQFWLIHGNTIYVLSVAPSSNISAWSLFDTGGFVVDGGAEIINDAIWLRAGTKLYIHGTGIWESYDSSQIEVVLPMVAGNEPATEKTFFAFDAAIEGTWQFYVGTDVQQPDVRELVATVGGPTFNMQSLGLANTGTHISVRAVCSDASRARLANLIFHYTKGSQD